MCITNNLHKIKCTIGVAEASEASEVVLPYKHIKLNINLFYIYVKSYILYVYTGTQRARTEHPDIAEAGEASEVDALGRHPLDGQLAREAT